MRRIGAAHPRSRGEHLPRGKLDRRGIGSSPLARGTLCFCVCALAHPRLIPARAGNTHAQYDEIDNGSAHPRSRGEHGWK